MKMMKFAVGLAAGYVLGSRAGREKYEQIVGAVRKATGRDQSGSSPSLTNLPPAGSAVRAGSAPTAPTPSAGSTQKVSPARPATRGGKALSSETVTASGDAAVGKLI
ncbi:hypothetical protein [Actinoplanes sp. NPDC051859]|uniref:hypothetical protein n=1 Tax=Actinoplanes sp. NPDC051859 TaxID=3363909 RepID=UPI00378FE099